VIDSGTRTRTHRRALLVHAIVLCALSGAAAAQLPLEPQRDAGQSVTPAFEGWFKNADGTFTLLVGYFNRNRKETLDIPVGPDNRIEPGGPDYGQPTHFLPRRNWGVFAIKVPADFGNRKLTWTIAANSKPVSIPLGLTKDYQIEPFKDAAQGNTPPVLRLSPDGPSLQGPPVGYAASLAATVGEPLTLTLWATDDGIVDPNRKVPEWPVNVTWLKHRGPGTVTITPAKPQIDRTDGKATATATFDKPGEYVLRAQANDVSGEGGGGFQCCWTNAHVKITVRPGS
jgi:hypothetical protein